MNEQYIQKVKINWTEIDPNSYLQHICALKNMNALEFKNNITIFVGENGTGKSTLLEAIAVAYGFNPEGGTLNYRFSTFDDVSELGAATHLVKGYRKAGQHANYFFRAESFFNVASKTEDYRADTPKEVYYAMYGGKSLHEQSHGESFLSYFQSFNQDGLYLMDEPEAALSPQRQLALLIQIIQMAKSGSQFIIASHSPILLGIPDADIISFDEGQIHPCLYEDTSSYQITEMFIRNRKRLIDELLSE